MFFGDDPNNLEIIDYYSVTGNTDCGSDSYLKQVTSLTPNKTYYWSIDTQSQQGDVWSFTTAMESSGPVDMDMDGHNSLVDCNDLNPNIHPGATEVCYNGIDDNCDGIIDENCSGGYKT